MRPGTVQDKGTVRQRREVGLVEPLTPRLGVDPLAVQPLVDRVRPGAVAGMKIVPKCHKVAVVLATAKCAGAMAGRESGRLVEEEQLGEPARLQQPLPAPAAELEPAGDPAPGAVAGG